MAPSPSISPHALTFGLIAVGGLACGTLGRSLSLDRSLRAPLNPFGINTSPYGEVIAMAMQGPIDAYWTSGVQASQASHHVAEKDADPASGGFQDRTRHFLDGLQESTQERTNPKPASKAQIFHTRRQIENKLRFAYELDPSHYGNFNAYHFFLTEPSLGTRPKLTRGAAELAQRTINYCLSRTDDPRPALTAAAATENMLTLMFSDHQHSDTPHYTLTMMRQHLALLDQCLARYDEIAAHWTATGNWELLSPQRRAECENRLAFVKNLRETAEATIGRIEQERKAPAATSN